MPYSTTSDVQTLLSPVGFSIGQTDPDTGVIDEPSSTTMENILIPAADEMIDGQLRELYTVPITNSTDLKLLKFISMRFAASMSAEYRFGDRADPDVNTVLLTHRDRAQDRLDLIQAGTLQLLSTRATLLDLGAYAPFTEEVSAAYFSQVKIDKEF